MNQEYSFQMHVMKELHHTLIWTVMGGGGGGPLLLALATGVISLPDTIIVYFLYSDCNRYG